ncbi:hypothetical protein CFIO01_02316 [Colletotrichum fioriniae PJ7]|uniref:Uncharacterized protein n=1 Tax=Colletotrichum fioriniae PJ7 TaxID=1445577 RepID=A0A010R108_9PEZI|nr:hypothetical protein CFIO01_02316 [Colletotrichum fioriniae PJ7]
MILNHEMEPVLSGRPSGIVKPEGNLQVNVGDGFSGSQGPRGIGHDSNMYTAYNTSGGLPTVEDKAHSMLPADHTDSPRVVRRKETTRVASSSRLMASKIQKKARLQPPSETFSQRLGSQNRYSPFPAGLADDTDGVKGDTILVGRALAGLVSQNIRARTVRS